MSQQLTISSIFATLAMAALCLVQVASGFTPGSSEALLHIQAAMPAVDLPALAIFTR